MKRQLFAVLALLAGFLSRAQAQTFPFNDCGTMVQGVTCPLLFQDSANLKWVLSSTSGLQLGDFVRVMGIADPGCFTFCQQGGCISVSSVGPCITSIGTPFCFGDGSGTPCPCGNSSAPGAQVGCLHSGALGGKLRATGTASVSGDTVVLAGSDMPNGPTMYFQGDAPQAAGNGIAFGDGKLCVGGALVRLGVKFNTGGASTWPSGSDPSLSVAGGVVSGDVRHYQSWYRDAATFCTGDTFNLTNGLTLTWAP